MVTVSDMGEREIRTAVGRSLVRIATQWRVSSPDAAAGPRMSDAIPSAALIPDYDPNTGTFSRAGGPYADRLIANTTNVLADGHVLVSSTLLVLLTVPMLPEPSPR